MPTKIIPIIVSNIGSGQERLPMQEGVNTVNELLAGGWTLKSIDPMNAANGTSNTHAFASLVVLQKPD
jgi:hypothetical protein